MKKIIQNIVFLIIFTCGFNLVHPSRVVFAQSLSISVSPPLLEVMIKPGKYITPKFKIKNNSDIALVTISLQKYDGEISFKNQDFEKEPWIRILNKNIQLDKPFLMEQNQEIDIYLLIYPPKDLADQDIYRALVFSMSSQNPQNQDKVSLNQSVASVILLNVTSQGQEKKASIKRFDTMEILDSFGPMEFVVEVENTGKTYFRPIGNIALSGPFLKASFDIVPNIILAGQKKILSLETNDSRSKNSIVIPGLFFGRYEITADFRLDEGNIRISQTKTVWALPYKAIIILITVYFVVSLSIKFFKNRRRSQK